MIILLHTFIRNQYKNIIYLRSKFYVKSHIIYQIISYLWGVQLAATLASPNRRIIVDWSAGDWIGLLGGRGGRRWWQSYQNSNAGSATLTLVNTAWWHWRNSKITLSSITAVEDQCAKQEQDQHIALLHHANHLSFLSVTNSFKQFKCCVLFTLIASIYIKNISTVKLLKKII